VQHGLRVVLGWPGVSALWEQSTLVLQVTSIPMLLLELLVLLLQVGNGGLAQGHVGREVGWGGRRKLGQAYKHGAQVHMVHALAVLAHQVLQLLNGPGSFDTVREVHLCCRAGGCCW